MSRKSRVRIAHPQQKLIDTMKLTLVRKYRKSDYTIGKLYVDGVPFCDTLEDTDRGLFQGMSAGEIARRKVYGQTAIPIGRYRVVLTHSAKFNKVLPLLVDVPGYAGVRIHSGNTAADSLGCVLVGVNNQVGRVNNSRATMLSLMLQLDKADEIEIEIKY